MSSVKLYEDVGRGAQHPQPNAVVGTRLRSHFERGDIVSIDNGLLHIIQADGHRQSLSPFCVEAKPLMREILTLSSRVYALEYIGCSTGFYGQNKAPGLTLQFFDLVSRNDAYTIFNVHLTRQRNTKAGRQGQPLPKGHFRISKGHKFYGFWESTSLPMPRRLASFHDYMGKLSGILFTGQKVGEKDSRLISGSVRPLFLSAAEIRASMMPDNGRTVARQQSDITRTNVTDNRFAECQYWQALQPLIGTYGFSHGKAVIRTRGNKDACQLFQLARQPQDQTVDEWLADYQGLSSGSW